MRRRDIVSGILLILSIIDFTLAAPVLGQEKHQAGVRDVVQIPKDVITVLGERAGGEELVEDYFKAAEESVGSSETPPPMRGNGDPTKWLPDLPSLNEHSSDQKLIEAPAPAPPPNPNKRPWTGTNPEDILREYWTNLVHGQPSKRPALTKESGVGHVDSGSESESEQVSPIKDSSQLHKSLVVYAPGRQTEPESLVDPNVDWNLWKNVENPTPLRWASPLRSRPSSTGPSDAGSPNARPSNAGPSNAGPSSPDPSNPSLPTELEIPSDQQPLT